MKRIVLWVEEETVFDMVKKADDNAQGFGTRLAMMVLGGGEMGMIEAIGLAVYGVTVVEKSTVPPEQLQETKDNG